MEGYRHTVIEMTLTEAEGGRLHDMLFALESLLMDRSSSLGDEEQALYERLMLLLKEDRCVRSPR